MEEIRMRLHRLGEHYDDEIKGPDGEYRPIGPDETVAHTGGCGCCTEQRALRDIPTEEIADWLDDIARAMAVIEAELARRTPGPVPADTCLRCGGPHVAGFSHTISDATISTGEAAKC